MAPHTHDSTLWYEVDYERVRALVEETKRLQRSLVRAQAANTALSEKSARDRAEAEAALRATEDVAKWSIRALLDVSEEATLLVNAADRVKLRAAFLDASPLLRAFKWRGREADSAEPLQLRAPDGAEWWWNASTLMELEKAVLDQDLRCIALDAGVDETVQAWRCARIWKLCFAFFPPSLELRAPEGLLRMAETRLIAWLRRQNFTVPDADGPEERRKPLQLALLLLVANESAAVREAAAACLTVVCPALFLTPPRQRALGFSAASPILSQEDASAVCRALNAKSETEREAAVMQTAVPSISLAVFWAAQTLELAAAASAAGDCRALLDSCLRALSVRYAVVLNVLSAPRLMMDYSKGNAVLETVDLDVRRDLCIDPEKWGTDAALLVESNKRMVGKYSPVFIHLFLDLPAGAKLSLSAHEPRHLLLLDVLVGHLQEQHANAADGTDADTRTARLHSLRSLRTLALNANSQRILLSVPLARILQQETWAALCARAAARLLPDGLPSTQLPFSRATPRLLWRAAVAMVALGGLGVDDALPQAALVELTTRVETCVEGWRMLPPLLASPWDPRDLRLFTRLLRLTHAHHAWPETYTATMDALGKAGEGVSVGVVAAALSALNLACLSNTTWTAAVRQALDAKAAAPPDSPFATAIPGHLARLQAEEPKEQIAAREAWMEMQRALGAVELK